MAHDERRRAAARQRRAERLPHGLVQLRAGSTRWWPSRASPRSRRGRAARRAGTGAAKRLRYQASPGPVPSATPPPARSSPAALAAAVLDLLVRALEAHDREAAALVAAHRAGSARPSFSVRAARTTPSAIVSRVSSSSESRFTSGGGARLLHHPQRVAALGELSGTTSPRSGAPPGAGRTRSVASQITPSTPSEPTTSSRRLGPAADAGTGLRAQLARGRHAAARASHQLVDAAVAGRRLPGGARGHPAAERSSTRTTAGSGRASRPARRRRRSSSGPSSPASTRAVSDVRSTSTVAASRPRSSDTTAREAVAHAAPRRPRRCVPPPNGTTATRCSRAQRRARPRTCVRGVAGTATASGALEASPERSRTRSG